MMQKESNQGINLGKDMQGAFPINVPMEAKEFSEQQLTNEAELIVNSFIKNALPGLFTMVANGEGKQKLDAVGGRPGERRSGLDLSANNWLTSIIKERVKQTGLPCAIFGEEDIDLSSIKDAKKYLIITDDPIDNSSPYSKGVKGAGVYSVKSFFDQDGKLIMGLSVDIENATVIVSKNGKNIMQKFEMEEIPNGDPKHKEFRFKTNKKGDKIMTTEEIFPSERKTLNDPDATFYTFMGERKWIELAINDLLPKLVDVLNPKAHNELSRGGSHLYPFYLATGSGEAYAISEEPVSELFTAWAAIKAANLTVWDVKRDGSHTDIEFDPQKYLENPELYQEDSIDFLVVAVTPEIAQEIAKSYAEQIKAFELEKAKIAFADSRPEEFEIFRASQHSQNYLNN
jgi:hypothetical protein